MSNQHSTSCAKESLGEGQCEKIKGGVLAIIGHRTVPAAQGDGKPCTMGDFNHEKVHGKHFHIFPSYSTIHAVPTHFLSFLKGWPFPVRAPKDQQVRTCGGFEHIYCLRFVGCFRQSGCIQKTKKKGRRGFAEEHAFWRGSREIEAGL